MPDAAPWQPEQIVATNLYPDPAMVGGAAEWTAGGCTVADGPEGGIKLTATGTATALTTNYSDTLNGLAGASTLYFSADVRVTGTASVGAMVVEVGASGADVGRPTAYQPAPAPGVWARVAFVLPLDAGTDRTRALQLIRSAGAAGDTTEWRRLRFSIVADGPYFDGDTAAADGYSYRWLGAPNASPSQKYLPEILVQPLTVGEWRLDYPGESFVFGRRAASEPFLLVAPDFGDPELATDDASRPREDGVAFGVDTRGGRTITFELGIVEASELAARQTLSALRRAWRADSVRNSPGAVAALTVSDATGERVYYGRPRRFAAIEEDVAQGVVTVVADFACRDDLAYSTAEHYTTVSLVPPPSGGLVAPLAAPLTTVPASATPGAITVAGDAPAWPVVTINGPITNPVVSVTSEWALRLAVSLAYDESLTIDTRPGHRSIVRNDGAPFPGVLTRTSVRLARAALAPGDYEVVLSGVDATGTSSMRFAWRDTLTT